MRLHVFSRFFQKPVAKARFGLGTIFDSAELIEKSEVLEVNMGFWREKFEAMAMAVAFAEAGEWDTARSLTKDTGAPRVGRTAKTRKRTENRPKKRLFRL
ncbi:MAG: hypothetical protein WBG50_26865 [Desulfomonilaceae bacterium]